MTRNLATVATLALALAGAGMGAAALTRTTPASSREVRALRTELVADEANLANDEASLSRLLSCVPEVVAEIRGLTIERPFSEPGDAWIRSTQQYSTYCASLLEPQHPWGHPLAHEAAERREAATP